MTAATHVVVVVIALIAEFVTVSAASTLGFARFTPAFPNVVVLGVAVTLSRAVIITVMATAAVVVCGVSSRRAVARLKLAVVATTIVVALVDNIASAFVETTWRVLDRRTLVANRASRPNGLAGRNAARCGR